MFTEITSQQLPSSNGPWAKSYIGARSQTLCIQPRGVDPFLPALASIYAEAFRGPPWFEQWSEQDAAFELQKYAADNSAFVISLDENGEPLGLGVGVLKVEPPNPPTWYIAELCTKESARRRGICSDILQGLLEVGAALGCPLATTRTRVNNEGMITIFKRAGFGEIERVQAVTGGTVSERVIFSCSLER